MFINETAKGWQVVIPNNALGVSKVYETDTKEQAQEIVKNQLQDRAERLSNIPTIQEYFNA